MYIYLHAHSLTYTKTEDKFYSYRFMYYLFIHLYFCAWKGSLGDTLRFHSNTLTTVVFTCCSHYSYCSIFMPHYSFVVPCNRINLIFCVSMWMTEYVYSHVYFIYVLIWNIENVLYWADAGLDRIERVDLVGKNRAVVQTLSDSHFYGLTFNRGFLYVTDHSPYLWVYYFVNSFHIVVNSIQICVTVRTDY